MKGLLLHLRHERGFFLPFILFVSLVLFSTVLTTIILYNNETKISYQLWEQMKAETIVQMAERKFKLTIPELEEKKGELMYTFPLGEATVTYEQKSEHNYHLTLEIITDHDELFIMKTLIVLSSEYE